jgi:hypothetical protein
MGIPTSEYRGIVSDGLHAAPSWVAPLRCALIERGFALVQEQRYNQPFGNYVAEFSRSNFHLQYLKDRGEWRLDVWDATHPTNDVGQPLDTSISMVRAVQDGVQDEADVVRYSVEDEVTWMIEHLDTTEQLVLDRSIWAVLHISNSVPTSKVRAIAIQI